MAAQRLRARYRHVMDDGQPVRRFCAHTAAVTARAQVVVVVRNEMGCSHTAGHCPRVTG